MPPLTQTGNPKHLRTAYRNSSRTRCTVLQRRIQVLPSCIFEVDWAKFLELLVLLESNIDTFQIRS